LNFAILFNQYLPMVNWFEGSVLLLISFDYGVQNHVMRDSSRAKTDKPKEKKSSEICAVFPSDVRRNLLSKSQRNKFFLGQGISQNGQEIQIAIKIGPRGAHQRWHSLPGQRTAGRGSVFTVRKECMFC
jgi:hypothetical protein